MLENTVLPFVLDPLDPKFVPAKPQHSIKEEKALALEQGGRLVITRKRDGYRHLAVVANGKVELYTRGIDRVTDRYPHVCDELLALRLPENTVLDGEMLVDRNGADDFEALTRIAKSSPAAAIELQKGKLKACYMIFDVIVWNGQVITKEPYCERQFTAQSIFYSDGDEVPHYVMPVHVLNLPLKKAMRVVTRESWEGLVLYDASKPTAFRLDGMRERPVRPDGCWKWKPLSEDDFIAERFEYGSGKNASRMGKLFLCQINPDTGERISCGEVGGGFSDEERDFFTRARYPLTVQVEFQKRFPSGALRHPQFMRIRDDKSPEECILPKALRKNKVEGK